MHQATASLKKLTNALKTELEAERNNIERAQEEAEIIQDAELEAQDA